MRYAKIMKNDVVDGDGVVVSLWVQGCPIHCEGCHNQGTWDFEGGKLFTDSTMSEILSDIKENGITRGFSVLGGEPLCSENIIDVYKIIKEVRKEFPDIVIYVWTGYQYEILKNIKIFRDILNNIDYLIDGNFILSDRDIRLKFRGSPNQRIIDVKKLLKDEFLGSVI